MSVRKIAVIVAVVLVVFMAVSPQVTLAANEHDAAEAQHEEPAHNGEGDHGGGVNPLAVDVDLAIWTAVVFVVLLTVLRKFAWGPIISALDSREQGIADNIAAAEARNEEAKQLLADYETKLSGAADQVRELLEEARRDAEHAKTQILAEAKTAAEAEHERAMRDVNNATNAALRTIAETGADLAVELAGRIVAEKLNAADHATLIRDAVEKVSAVPSQN